MQLLDRIDNYLVEVESKPRSRHYPSDIGACKRQLFWKWKAEPETTPVTAGGYWKMKMGNKIHDLIYDFLEDEGLEIVNEISNRKKIEGLKYEFSYRIDILFINPETGRLQIAEAKTSFGRGIRAIKNAKMPKDTDLQQVICYMELEDIPEANIIYIGRDDGYRCEFVIKKTESGYTANGHPVDIDFQSIVNKLKDIERHVDNDILPGRDFQVAIKKGEIRKDFQKDKVKYKSDWQCMYCRWLNKCWKDEVGKYKDSDNADELNSEDKDGS